MPDLVASASRPAPFPCPVVVTGMHRSGTSYIASWFVAAGVDMGERLVAADAANRSGYFEDLDFLALDRRMLAAATPAGEAGHADWGWSESERLDEARFAGYEQEARALAARRAAGGRGRPWGWKDPRTALALDFWQRVLGAEGLDPFYVLPYRLPWQVADSMQRLGAEAFLRHPEYALRIWSFYNRRLLAWKRREPERTLLMSVDALRGGPARFATLVCERLGLALAAEPPAEIFAPELLAGCEPGDPVGGLVALTSPEVTALLGELDQAADLPAAGLWEAAPPVPRTRRRQAPSVSVIVPCHDHGEFLIDALASYERCASPEAEILIVDDGSTQPRTVEVLEALRAAGYEVLEQPNSGVVAARNRGVEEARAPYILPLDSDNRLRPGFVAAAVAALDADPAVGVVYGDRWEFGLRSGRVRVPDFDLDRLLTGNYIDACAVFRKRAWEECGGYDPALSGWEDWELWIAIARRGWRFHRLEGVTFDYRVRPDSMVAALHDAEAGSKLQRHIVTKHRELYLDRLPALLTAVQHGRLGAAGGLMTQAARAQELAMLRADLEREALRAARQSVLAELSTLRREHAALIAEGEGLGARVAELETTLESWQSAAAGFIAERDRLDREISAWRERVAFMEATRAWRLRDWVLWLRGRKHLSSPGSMAVRKQSASR